jgi:transposase
VVRAPSHEAEDARRLHRELERLKRERLAHRVRMQSLLVVQGIRVRIKDAARLRLRTLTLWDGRALPEELRSELEPKQSALCSSSARSQPLKPNAARGCANRRPNPRGASCS